jgi:inhibitor of KinA
MTNPTLIRLHETAWLIQWSPGINLTTNQKVHACAQWLQKHALPGLLQVQPAYDSLFVEFGNTGIQQDAAAWVAKIETWLLKCVEALIPEEPGNGENIVKIPVCFDESLGSDIAAISSFAGISADEAISLFTNITYHVFMLGFLPGFPYMGAVNERIAIPRKKQPAHVNAGAVGIAGIQTGIYPVPSPGGWHIIGHTPLQMFDLQATHVTLLQPGQQVKFYAIDSHTYHQTRARL